MIESKLDQVYPDKKNTLSRELKDSNNQKYILPESLTLTYKNIEVIDEAAISETVKSTPYVHLSHNKLSNLNGVTAFHNLQGLSVSHNQLKHWKQLQVIKNPNRIQFLRVRRNPLCRNPNYHAKLLSAFPNLQSLDEVSIDEKCLQIKYQTQHGSQALFTQLLKFMQAEFEKIESKMSILYPQIETSLNQTLPTVSDIDFEFFDLLMAFLNNDPTLKLKKSASSILLGGFFIRLWKMLGSRLLSAPVNMGAAPSAIQIDLLHRILDKYRDRHEHSLEQFLQSQCEENDKVDKERLNSDLSYGYACFLDELYKISEPPEIQEYLFVKEHLGVSFEGFSSGNRRSESNYPQQQQPPPQQQQQQQQQQEQQYTFRSELGLSTDNAEQYAKEQKNLKQKQSHSKNMSELTPKNASYFLQQQEQAANAAKVQQGVQQEDKRRSSQQTEMLMLRNYFPLFLLNQDYMEVIFECLVEKMISLLIAYELLLYGELEQSSAAVIKKFQKLKSCFKIFDPAGQIFLAIENIGNRSRRQSNQNSKRDDRPAGTATQLSKAEQSILNLKKQSESVVGSVKDKSRSSMQNEKEEEQKQASAIDELNSTLARINFKRGSQLSRRSSSGLPLRPSSVSFQQHESLKQSSMIRKQGEQQQQSMDGIIRKNNDQSRTMENQQELLDQQQHLDQEYATNAQSNTYETQNNRDIQLNVSRQSAKSLKEKELENKSNQQIRSSHEDGQIRGRMNTSGNRLTAQLDSSSLENRLKSIQLNNSSDANMSYRQMVTSQQGIWEENSRKQRSLQKAQYFAQIVRVILWKKAQEILTESWEHLRIASDKKYELLARIVNRRQARNTLRKWQRRNLKVTKNALFTLLHLQKYFNLLRNYTKNKIIIAEKQYATQMQLKVFFGIVRILRNKRKIKKGLRKITRVVRKSIIQPTFEHMVYYYLRIPRNAQEQEIDYARFFQKSKQILSQPSLWPQIQQSQEALQSIRNARGIESLGYQIQNHNNSNRIASAEPETDKQTIQIKDSFRAASQQISDLNNPSRIQPKYSGLLLQQPSDSQYQKRSLIPEYEEDNKKTIKPKNDSKNNKNSNISTTKYGAQTIQKKDSSKKALAKLR